MVATLLNVDVGLAKALAKELGMALPKPLPKVLKQTVSPEVKVSPALSLMARPGNGSIATRRIAILVADGVDGEAARALHDGLAAEGAVPRWVGVRLGAVETTQGDSLEVEVTLETAPSVLFDAVAILGGPALGQVGHALEFVKDQYRHAKPILVGGEGEALLQKAGVPLTLASGQPDPGIVVAEQVDDALSVFVKAIARHRHHEREMDPPAI
jgi:catalase